MVLQRGPVRRLTRSNRETGVTKSRATIESRHISFKSLTLAWTAPPYKSAKNSAYALMTMTVKRSTRSKVATSELSENLTLLLPGS